VSYEILTVEEFRRDIKKLHKKYRSIKKDILDLIQRLEDDAYIGIDLGNSLYEIRVRNSDIGGKSGGYRVIYYTRLSRNRIYLLAMYAKSQKETIDTKQLAPILKRLQNSDK